MDNWIATVLAEYQSDPVMMSLLPAFNEAIDPSSTIDDFYTNAFDLDTCGTWGLDVWGKIVGVSRVLKIAQTKYFGFDEATSLSAEPWNSAPYYGGQPLTDNYALDNDGFRTLIYAKAYSNISNGSAHDINLILMTLFSGRGNAYVIDNLDTTYTLRFEFQLTEVEISIVQASGVLQKLSGFSVLYSQATI